MWIMKIGRAMFAEAIVCEGGVFSTILAVMMRRNDTPLTADNDVYDAVYRYAAMRRVDAQYSLDKNNGGGGP